MLVKVQSHYSAVADPGFDLRREGGVDFVKGGGVENH